jgi:hypothetical protein
MEKKHRIHWNLVALPVIAGCIMGVSCKTHTGVPCTEEYRMLTVSIKDTSSNPVLLSKYFVKKTSTGETIDFSKEDPYLDSINRIQGIYFVCTDGKLGMTSSNGTEFEFHGISGNIEIVNEKYLIGNDQCHIKMLSGKTEVIISR